MPTLAELQKEAEQQSDAMNNPRTFLAIFPAGPRKGKFSDPYMGIMEFEGMPGFVMESHFSPLTMFDIQAVWLDNDGDNKG